MSVLEVLEEVRQLPVEEQRLIRDAIDSDISETELPAATESLLKSRAAGRFVPFSADMFARVRASVEE